MNMPLLSRSRRAKRFARRFLHVWQRLTTPAASVKGLGNRQRAQLLAALLIPAIPLGTLIAITLLSFTPTAVVALIAAGAIVALILAYGLSRSRYYRWGAAIFVSVIPVGVLVSALVEPRAVIASQSLYYLAFALFLSTTLFASRGVIVLIIAILLEQILLSALIPDLSLRIVARPLVFNLITGGVMLVTGYHFIRLTQARQARLEKSEQRYRALFEAANDALFLEDLDGRVLDVNTRACELLGYSKDELLSLTIDELVPTGEFRILPQDGHDDLTTGIRLETVNRHKDGHLIPVEGSGRQIQIGDEARLLVSVRDITEQKRLAVELQRYTEHLEELIDSRVRQLRVERDQQTTILQNVADAVVFTDLEANILYVNPAWERLTGYPFAAAVGQNSRMLKSGETPPDTYRALWDTLTRGETWRGVLHNKHKNGSLYDAEITIEPVLDAAGQPQSYVGMMRDVTETRRLEAIRSRLIANASHELRTPITNILLRLYLLHKQPEKRAYHLDIVAHEAQRMKQLIEDMLDISRLERGTITLTWGEVALSDLLARVVEVQRPQAEAKHIHLVSHLPPPPLWTLGDASRLMQVITNLVVNAITYTPAGGQITVALDVEQDRAVIRVQDTGVGISPDVRAQVFEPFFRIDDTTVRGTGLGLTIAKEIVELHGGDIVVHSEMGRGSTFSVTLRLLDPARRRAPARPH